jgi:hypothetical protein
MQALLAAALLLTGSGLSAAEPAAAPLPESSSVAIGYESPEASPPSIFMSARMLG